MLVFFAASAGTRIVPSRLGMGGSYRGRPEPGGLHIDPAPILPGKFRFLVQDSLVAVLGVVGREIHVCLVRGASRSVLVDFQPSPGLSGLDGVGDKGSPRRTEVGAVEKGMITHAVGRKPRPHQLLCGRRDAHGLKDGLAARSKRPAAATGARARGIRYSAGRCFRWHRGSLKRATAALREREVRPPREAWA